jgi:peptidoglycan/xylan/chitin deacetylase (PgdA/CDA1 family)
MMFLLLLACAAAQNIYPTSSPANSSPDFEAQFDILQITDENAKGGNIFNTCTGEKKFALSFDDGPKPPTLKLLDLLKEKNIKATFFVTGLNVRDHRDILKRAHNEGHEIGIHTWSHTSLPTLSNSQIMSELLFTQMIIEETIGVKSVLMRPPYGDLSDRVLDVIYALGMKPVLWGYDTQDALLGPSAVLSNVKKWINEGVSGGISLQHDIQESYVAQASQVIEAIAAFGVNFVKVSDCIGETGVVEPLKTTVIVTTTAVESSILSIPVTSTIASSTQTTSTIPNAAQISPTGSAARIFTGHLLSLFLIFLY